MTKETPQFHAPSKVWAARQERVPVKRLQQILKSRKGSGARPYMLMEVIYIGLMLVGDKGCDTGQVTHLVVAKEI
jgi:hypothetical protein